MPRLSIIIPHRGNDLRLEATILSVLENRPDDSEVIVVHNGSYADPYDLADELLYIESDAQATSAQLLNAGALAACAPVVCTLLDGITVTAGWAEPALNTIATTAASAVAVATRFTGAKASAYGISAEVLRGRSELQRGKVELADLEGECGGPQLTCGFYTKKLLRAVGGWDERLELTVADIDLAWTLQALDIHVACSPTTEVQASSECKRIFSNRAMKQLGELAVAYGVTEGGAKSAVSELLRGCLGGSVSLAVAWASGVMSGRATEAVKARLAMAEEKLRAPSQPELKVYAQSTAPDSWRRAA